MINGSKLIEGIIKGNMWRETKLQNTILKEIKKNHERKKVKLFFLWTNIAYDNQI